MIPATIFFFNLLVDEDTSSQQNIYCIDFNFVCFKIIIRLVTVLYELTNDSEVQEVWLSAVFQLNATLIVPMESLRRQIRSHFGSMVEIRYPDLVNNGICYFGSLRIRR